MCDDLKFLIDVVKGASLLITDEFEVKAKDEKGDLVTNFDYEIEKYIIDKIKEEYPDNSIVSEEYNSDKELSSNCFTIDPIDGTVNFANNIPLWGIQVACIKNNSTCAAVIYLPRLEELYYADSGGAYLNGKRIHVNNLDYNNALYAIDGIRGIEIQTKMRKFSTHFRSFGSAAVNFSWVASGRLGAIVFGYNTVWDYTPGMYLVRQAGGYIYNDSNIHIAANSSEFLEILKDIVK